MTKYPSWAEHQQLQEHHDEWQRRLGDTSEVPSLKQLDLLLKATRNVSLLLWAQACSINSWVLEYIFSLLPSHLCYNGMRCLQNTALDAVELFLHG